MKTLIILIIILYSTSVFSTDKKEYRRYVGIDVGHSVSSSSSPSTGKQFNTDKEPKDKPKANPSVPHGTPPNPMPPNLNPASNAPDGFKLFIKTRHKADFINFYSGYYITPFASLEFGGYVIQPMLKSKSKISVRNKVVGLQGGMVFPIPVTSNLSILPGIGMSYASVYVYKPNHYDYNQSGIIPRLMLATEYKITDTIKIRGSMIWYRTAGIHNDNFIMNNTLNFGIGFNYSFQKE